MTCGECANVTAPGKGFPNHVYCLRFLLHMEKREDASRCRYFIPKPQTNADRIRAMSDEELSTFLFNNVSCSDCTMHGGGCSVDCEKWMLSWLKDPADKEEE